MPKDSQDNLKILNWNACGLAARKSELQHLLEEEGIDIACITETHLKPKHKIFIENFKIYRFDRTSSRGGGVAILIRESIQHEPISVNSSSLESCGIKVSLKDHHLRIICTYSPPTANNIDELPEVLSSNMPTVLAGDLNAKHSAWGCRSGNPKGNTLQKILLRHNLTIEAPRDHTHYPVAENYNSDILDIFITRNVPLHKDPYTLPKLSSDHNPVILEIPGKADPLPPTEAKLDWLHLKYLLETSTFKCNQLRTVSDIDNEVTALTTEITDAIQKATAIKPAPSQPGQKLPLHLVHLIRKKNKTRRLWQRFRKRSHRQRLNALQRKISAELSDVGDAAFENYIAQAEAHPKSAWKVIKSLRNRQPHPPPLIENGKAFSLDEDRARIFAESLRDQCSPFESTAKHTAFHEKVSKTAREFTVTEQEFQPTSPAEIEKIIRTLKNNKAPGKDAIKNKVLKILPRIHVVTICNIINAMMRLQYFPDTWKEATVICLPKAGKPLNAPSSFRPISLLCTISKIAEAVILARIVKFTEDQGIIPSFQHGFMKQHGTGHQLLRVTEHIAEKMNLRHQTTMLLLDAKQAFDRVWHDGLIHKLITLGYPHYLIGIVRSWLTGRRIRVRAGKSLSDPQEISAGVPQGSKLSPTLFNIYCYDIPTDKRIMTAQYADDVALIFSTRTITYATTHLNRFLPKLIDWYKKWRFEINETKSDAVFFSRHDRKPDNVIVNSHRVPWSSNAKYLGVTFDRKLNWTKQIEITRKKAVGAFTALRPFFNNRAVSQGMKARAFNAIIRSITTYAIPIWGSVKPKKLEKLQGTYMRLLRAALNIPWYLRNNQILTETKILPLPEAARVYATNLRRSVENHPNPSIRDLANYHTKRYDLVRRPCCLINQQPNPQ